MRATAESVDGKFAALACAVLFAAAGVASHAQAPVQGAPAPAAPAPAAAGQPPVAQPQAARPSEFPKVSLTAGRSTVLATDFNITRIAITNPAVADAAVVQPREILIDGKTAGTISLIVWGPTGRTQYDIVVEQPVTALQQNLAMLFPGEDIQVSTTRGLDHSFQGRSRARTSCCGRERSLRRRPPSGRSSTCCRCLAAARASRCCCRSASPK